MPIVNIKDMLSCARANEFAVPAFEIDSLETLSGAIRAAETSQSPLVLSVTEAQLNDSLFESLVSAIETMAQQTSIPVAIQFEQATSFDTAVRAINAGCNSIMLDASVTDISLIKNIASMAHDCGVTLGSVCQQQVMAAGMQLLEEAVIDVLLLKNDADDRLVLPDITESASNSLLTTYAYQNITDTDCHKIIESGMTMIQFGTLLQDITDSRIRLNAHESETGYRKLMQGITGLIQQEASECIQLCLSAGQADNLLKQCQPWLPVEHVIIFNVEGINDEQARTMMAEGQKSLAGIPGVRHVVIAQAVKDDAKYRFSWLVRFCHPAVIDSYREHPVHVDFADRLFRPVAGDRISIDYQWNCEPLIEETGVISNSAAV